MPLLCTLFRAKLGQADVGDNEAKLMTKLRTSDPVIRSPARYRWTTAPAYSGAVIMGMFTIILESYYVSEHVHMCAMPCLYYGTIQKPRYTVL